MGRFKRWIKHWTCDNPRAGSFREGCGVVATTESSRGLLGILVKSLGFLSFKINEECVFPTTNKLRTLFARNTPDPFLDVLIKYHQHRTYIAGSCSDGLLGGISQY